MKYLFILFTLLWSKNLWAQKIVSTDMVTFTVPSETLDISLSPLKQKKLSQNFILGRGKKYSTKQLLESGDMALYINADNWKTEENYLKELRESYLYEASLLRSRKYTITAIKSHNDLQYFTSEYESQDDPGVYLMFFAVNKNRTKTIRGAAEYSKSTRKISQQSFSAFINSLKFK
jgi:hypothetical protein